MGQNCLDDIFVHDFGIMFVRKGSCQGSEEDFLNQKDPGWLPSMSMATN
jgi:hypothetical protein